MRNALISLVLLALTVYGSLYPFAFHRVSFPLNPLVLLWSTVRFPPDRGDVVSNILLYLPLAFFAVRAFPRLSPAVRCVLVALSGAILATSIELAQFYDLGRIPSFYDAAADTAGAALGGMAGVAVRRVSAAMLLLAAWFGSRLVPYVPSFDIHKYGFALRQIFAGADFLIDPADFFHDFMLWLVAAALIQFVFEKQRSARLLVCGIFLVFAARIVLIDTSLTASEVFGATAAAILWIAFLSRLNHHAAIVCAMLAAFIAIDALRPFHFISSPRRFGLVPFRSFMDDSREHASRVFLEKTFIYGSLLWLLRRSGVSLAMATFFALALVLTSRLVQMYLPGRSAEITDPLMVLMFAGLMALLPE